jgi:hypothetical protein
VTECSCEGACIRWGVFDDGSGGFFTPYDPFKDTVCQLTLNKIMKPTTIKKEERNDRISKIILD